MGRLCIVVSCAAIAAGCSFDGTAPFGGPSDGGNAASDSTPMRDARGPDARLALPLIYAGFEDDLWTIDFDGNIETEVGDLLIGDVGINLQGFAITSTIGYGIDQANPPNLLEIDLFTGAATILTPLSEDRAFWGLTVVPKQIAGTDLLYAGTNETPSGALYQIDTTTGAVTRVGAFGSDYRVSGDITFVAGVGLVGSFNGTTCVGNCLGSINRTTGQVTAFTSIAPSQLYGLASLNGRLFALTGSASIIEFDPATGATIDSIDTTNNWSMAGP